MSASSHRSLWGSREGLVSWGGQQKLKYLHTRVQRHLGTAKSYLLRALVWVGRECLIRGLNPVFISQLTAPVSRLSSTLRLFGQPLLSHILVVHGFPPSQAVWSLIHGKRISTLIIFAQRKKFYQYLKRSNFNLFSCPPPPRYWIFLPF